MKKTILYFSVALFGLNGITAQTTPSYLSTNGLVGWWPFNGNSKDESGNSNHGTVYGSSLSTDRFGKANQAYSFNGDIENKIIVPNSASLDVTGPEITLSMWMWSDNPVTESNFKGISKGGWVSGAGYELLLRNSYNGDNGVYQFSIPNNSNTTLSLIQNANNNKGKWVHLAGTFNNGVAKTYLNGVLNTVVVLNNINVLKSSNADLYFGPRHPSNFNAAPMLGKLDDIGIWNRELSAKEILDLYNACESNFELSLLGNAPLIKGSDVSLTFKPLNLTAGTYQWQSDLGIGFQNLIDTNQYAGTTTNELHISDLQLRNNHQSFKVIFTSQQCQLVSKPFELTFDDTCTVTKLISVTDTLLINMIVTSEPNAQLANTIKVYPNPTHNILMINYGNHSLLQGYSMKITNAMGSTVYVDNIRASTHSINLSTLGQPGLYFLQIIDAQNHIKETRKIILQ